MNAINDLYNTTPEGQLICWHAHLRQFIIILVDFYCIKAHFVWFHCIASTVGLFSMGEGAGVLKIYPYPKYNYGQKLTKEAEKIYNCNFHVGKETKKNAMPVQKVIVCHRISIYMYNIM